MTQPTYTIQQAAAQTGLSVHTLRYYEDVGILSGIQRNGSGHRCYDEQDLGWINWLKMLRNSGMSIDMIRDFVQLSRQGNDSIEARCQILDAHRQKIQTTISELEGYLHLLDQKLLFYRGLEDE